MKRRFQFGFTLIELLVVIAIIAILAAILFPVFAQAREKARQTVCLSNMKQISTAMLTYTSDYDGYWPRSEGCSDTPLTNPAAPKPWQCFGGNTYALRLNQYKWQGWLMPYVKNVDIFFCPSRADKAKANPLWVSSGEIYGAYALSTPITGYINKGSYDAHSFLGRGSLAGLQTPAETFVVMEGANPNTSGLYPKAPANGGQTTATGELVESFFPLANREAWKYYLLDSKNPPAEGPNVAKHSNGFIFSFCDGHAKWLSLNTFLEKCPPYEQYPNSTTLRPDPTNQSGNPSLISYENQQAVIKSDWPLWGLVKNQ